MKPTKSIYILLSLFLMFSCEDNSVEPLVCGEGTTELNGECVINCDEGLTEVETGGGGLPASPYMPNLTSPGPGSINAADQPEFTGDIPDLENNIEFISSIPSCDFEISDTSDLFVKQTKGNFLTRFLKQITMIFNNLGSDGGLFVLIGKKR